MHWTIWQTARKRRTQKLERERQIAIAQLDSAELAYDVACGQLGYANQTGQKAAGMQRIAMARKAMRLASEQALAALDRLNEGRSDG